MNLHRGRMKRYFLLLPAILLAGCGGSLFESKKIDYKSEVKAAPGVSLEVPPDLTTPSRDDRYAVPDAKTGTSFSTYAGDRGDKPAATDVLPQVDKMRIERSGTQRWLVVSGSSPDKLWPTIKDFWLASGFTINAESPQTGIMETDWAENRAKLPQDFIRNWVGKVFDSLYSTSERDRFRTRLEKAADGSTEVYISHRGLYEVYSNEGKTETRWQPRPPEPELEAEMLSRLMVRLGAGEAQAKTLVAAETKTVDKAKLAADAKGSLRLEEPFDRAWRRVGLALYRVGFTVEDRDLTQGIYFVRYVDPEVDLSKKQKTGFIDRLMFWKDSTPDALKNAQFRILVKAQGEASMVTVLTREGGLDQSETSNKIVGLLLNQLK